ncbi:alpha/beta hydrolase [Sphingobacterium olei]|uniref:Alpha/beta hydrolase n=1 Tax=Sphingobacterium olei TaxID=2571155 RepID=A0A4U0NLK0_9SPHI|nr:alpha/beta hydrolase [Sphingobacterium olei]TJZ50874.1 alpha/beta hydrolase [Sphingobacterium olei]
MSKQVFAFSGLGADKRVFQQLDFSDMEVIHIKWLQPREEEYLGSYVHRLAEHYHIPKHGATVIGLSFGGICVSELAKTYDFEKIVLLSSAKTKMELPKSYALTSLLSLHKLIPETQLTKPNALLDWLFGVSSTHDRETLADIIQDTDVKFLKWAIHRIANWKNTVVPTSCLHIHGDKDRIIPIRNVDYSIKIKGGGHFMTLNKAEEISFHVRNYIL